MPRPKKIDDTRLQLRLELARKDFWEFCKLMAPDFYMESRPYLKDICNQMQAFAESPDERVMVINCPPRHGKSRTAQLFTAWNFGRKPSEKVITGSYNEQLSTSFSRAVRDLITERKASSRIVYSDIFPAISIKRGSSAANMWTINGQHISYLATSPNGTVTGFGASCFPAGTMISTQNGQLPIESFFDETSQKVLTYNHKRGTIEEKPVEVVRRKVTHDLVKVVTEKGTFYCTPDHHVYAVGRGYVRADNLGRTDTLVSHSRGVSELPLETPQISDAKVIRIEAVPKDCYVYDLQVADNHNFFANGFLVHNCMIIDDIIRNADEAYNETILQNIWEWFTNTMLSRLEAGGKLIVIATRWHSDDLSGHVMRHYEDIGVPVRRIIMKALQDDGTMLCPEVLDRPSYDILLKTMGRDIVEANYNNQPVDMVGRLYQQWFKEYSHIPKDEDGNSLFEGIYSYCDTADQGNDFLCNLIYGWYDGDAYMLDVYYTDANMIDTEPETAKRLHKYHVDKAYIESNSGGRGFGRSIERILREKYHTTKPFIELFYQNKNKGARILGGATWVQEHVFFPTGWRNKWPDFFNALYKYQKEIKGNKHDDGPDALTGIYDKMGRPNLFSFD